MTAATGKRLGTWGAALALVGALFVAMPHAAHADSGGLDLSQYSLVARYDLPEPTRTTAPTGSLLAQEASSVTYDWDTDTLFVVGDGGTSVVQVSKSGKLIDSMSLAPGDSPQGTTFYDTEAITYIGSGKFVGEERYRQVNLFTYVAGGVLQRSDVQTVKLGTTVGNVGIEGITYDPQTSSSDGPGFVAVKEVTPESIFQTNVDFAGGTATNGSPTTDESTDLFDPALAGLNDFSDVFALSNEPTVAGADASNLLLLSQESGKIENIDRSGHVVSSLSIVDPTSGISVQEETHEGLTMDRSGYLYTVNEAGGGDASHPQLWVYAPPSLQPSVPRMTITEAAPWGSSASYGADWFELTNNSSSTVSLDGWKMDDSSSSFASAVPLAGVSSLPAGASAVFFEDTGLTDSSVVTAFTSAWFGSSSLPSGALIGHYGGSGVGLSTSGDGINVFDASGNRVTGISFGASPSGSPLATSDNRGGVSSSGSLSPAVVSRLSVASVNGAFASADGSSIGSPFTVASSTTPPPPPSASVIVSEVAPWGSGSSAYGADWFEVTNTSSSAVSLDGWKMDDSSASSATAVPLLGVSSLPAGKSAVFFEDTGLTDSSVVTAFASAWFGSSSLPSGTLIGHYGGSGVGLSTGGDGVVLFDSSGALVTGVAFGASPSAAPFATFDNAAGLGSVTAPFPVVSALSAAGVAGAFASADGTAIGSPFGVAPVGAAPSVIVSEVAPWGSGSSAYGADWFEVTNTGSSAVSLSGWRMDDSSASFASAVPLLGVSSLPAGKSAVFFEDTGLTDSSVVTAFASAWFGASSLPAGFRIGHYGGSGVGLSTGGDAVSLFDASGSLVTGVAFGASPSAAPFASFDNTAGLGSSSVPLPTVSTLSAVGVNGAFAAADGTAIGSPAGAAAPDLTPPVVTSSASPAPNSAGWNNTSVTVSYTCTDTGSGVDSAASSLADDVLTSSGTAFGTCVDKAGNSAAAPYGAQIDTDAPQVSFTGAAATYGILGSVSIACSASDALSGVASSTCASVSGPAWSFGAGAHTVSAQATDEADNVGTASVSFTVTVAPRDLAALTTQFVQGSARYQAAGPVERLVVSAVVSTATSVVLQLAATANPTAKAALLAVYRGTVQSLVSGGWVTASQATTLVGPAAAI